MAAVAMRDDARWFVVATKPMSEATAERTITALGFEVFGPVIEGQVARRGRLVAFRRPMFPHYLFVAFDPARDPWRRIATAFGVSRVLTTGAPSWTPLPLPRGFVDRLRTDLSESGCRFSKAEKPVTFEEDDEVLIRRGRWVELVGRIISLDPHGRVRVMMRLLGGDRPATVHVSQLRKLDG